jgi:hypothetical protein
MSSTRPSREDRRGRRRGHLGRKPKAHNYFNSSSNLHIRNKHPTRETNFYNFDDRFPKKDKIFKISRAASQQRAHRKSTPTTVELSSFTRLSSVKIAFKNFSKNFKISKLRQVK